MSPGRNTATFCYAPGSGVPMRIWSFSRRSVMQSITFNTPGARFRQPAPSILEARTFPAASDRHALDPDIVGEPHVLNPQPVRNRGKELHIEFRKQVRRDGHVPGVGDRCDLAQFGQPAAHWIGLQDRQPRIFEKRLEVKAREMRLAADDAQIERLGH